jgi:hypothetical protein
VREKRLTKREERKREEEDAFYYEITDFGLLIQLFTDKIIDEQLNIYIFQIHQ